jgi:hypothetical protein
MRLRAIVSFAFAICLWTSAASAQPAPPSSPSATPSPSPSPQPPGPRLPSIEDSIWAAKRQFYGTELHVAPMWSRRVGGSDVDAAQGWEFGYGSTSGIRQHGLFLTGITAVVFRVFDAKSFAFTLDTHSVAVGAMIGPLEPEVRAGFSFLSVDVFHGDWSVELLSPRASAGFDLRITKAFRLGAQAYTEFFWRWFGPSYRVEGVSLAIRVENLASSMAPPPPVTPPR